MTLLTTSTTPDARGTAPSDRRLAALVGAVTVSSVGDGVVVVAFPLLALRSTAAPLLVALVAVVNRAAAAAMALPAGVVVDRVDRRRLVTAVNAARIAALGVLAVGLVAGVGGLALLYATVALLGAGEVLVDLAMLSTVPALVPRDRLPAIGGYLSGADVGAESLVGPAAGGALTAAGAWVPVVGDLVSFVVATVLARRALRDPGQAPAPTEARTGASVAADLRAGFALYRRTPALRTVAGTVGVLAACSTAVLAVLAVLATRHLGLHASGYGLFLATAAVGQVLGSVLAGRAWALLGPGRALLVAAVVAAGCYLLLATTRSVPVAAVALAVESLVVGVGDAAAGAVRQLSTPAELLGRSGAVYRLVVFGLMPLGALTGGLVAQVAGAPTAVACAGLAQLLVAALVARRLLGLTVTLP